MDNEKYNEKLRKTEKVIEFALKIAILKSIRDMLRKNSKLKKRCGNNNKDEDDLRNAEIKKLWLSFLDNFTLNGFRHVFEKGIIRRIVWLLILSMALFAVIFSARKSLTKYFERPITTTVNMVYQDEIVFPAVTLCNFNFFPHYLINGTIGEKVR